MALPATIVWEVRPTTATSADNGGGFDSAKIGTGTDRSQQAGVQVNIDNAAITCTTPAANSNVLTFTAGYSPVAVDEGNTVAITAGTNINAGLYVINSVVVGTSWTLAGATNLTTAGGAGSAVVGKMGGARTGFSTGTTTLQSKVLAGHIVWVKNEAWNEAVSIAVNGAAGTPIVVEGYNTVRGDAPTGANRPHNNRAAAAGTGFNSNGTHHILKYLWVSNAGGSGIVYNQAPGAGIGLRSNNNGSLGISCAGVAPGFRFQDCEADNNTGQGFSLGNLNGGSCFGCNAHQNTVGFDAMGGTTLVGCLSWANTSHGYLTGSTNPFHMFNCVADGNTGVVTDGLNVTTPQTSFIFNCVFSNNGRDGARAVGGSSIIADYNDYFGNVGVPRTNITAGANDVALDPQFTNRAGGDFSIGINLRALGFPGVFPASVSTGYMDIGAVQRQEAAAGGSAPYPMRG